MHIKGAIVFLLIILIGCGGGGSDSSSVTQPPVVETATVLAANDLGMHCMDREFSVFSILPPFNVVNAQVVKRDGNGRPYVADDAEVDVFYQATADASGSINTYSIGKTDFWTYANALFGVTLPEGQGLTGLYMPADDPQVRGSQPMEYSLDKEWFAAEGIPITPTDDRLIDNPYPLLRISAVDAQSAQTLGNLDVVLPVATETDCQNCHRTGAMAAEDPGIVWSADPDLEIQSKINILRLHDAEHSTADLEASQPVLCAQCHYSPALDLAGTGPEGDQLGKPNFSNVMHEFHGELQDNGQPVFPSDDPVENTCYQCHPGSITQCQRGAMKTGGMDCNDCHGDMLAVGGKFVLLPGGSIDGANDGNPRRPWVDLPRCQSCHTGDAVEFLSVPNLVADRDWPFRLRQAFATGDASASPLLALNTRFAEDTDTLFRFSKGHGGIACENCHGSTHAIWPNDTNAANDNEAAKNLQGYAGTIIECSVCHESGSLPRTTNGPHGLHNINDSRWYDDGHEDAYEADKNSCKACHGLNLTGTPLAKMPTSRSFRVEDHTITYVKGDLVRCDKCHGMPEL
jgi:hypothetical protein